MRIRSVLVALILLVILPPYVASAQSVPCIVVGTATVDGLAAPVGTVVSAVIGSEVVKTQVIVTKGDLGTIQIPQGNGTEISFRLDSITANETISWKKGACGVVSLTANSTDKMRPDFTGSIDIAKNTLRVDVTNEVDTAKPDIAEFINPSTADNAIGVNIAGKPNSAVPDIKVSIDPEIIVKAMSEFNLSDGTEDEEQLILQKIEQEKKKRLAELTRSLQLAIEGAEENRQRSLDFHKQGYENDLAEVEDIIYDPDIERIQFEIETKRNELALEEGIAPELERLFQIEIPRLESQLINARQRLESNRQATIVLIENDYLANKRRVELELEREVSRIESDNQKEILIVEESLNHELQQQLSELERVMRDEEREEQFRLQMESDERRMKMEEQRLMEITEERMQRDLQMQEERVRMEQERIQNNSEQLRGMGQDQGLVADVDSEPLKKRRGFLSNPKPGQDMRTIDMVLDPTMLAMVGIGLTVLATGITLFRSN